MDQIAKDKLVAHSKVLVETKNNIHHLKNLVKSLDELSNQSLEEKMLLRRVKQMVAALECYQEHASSLEECRLAAKHRLQQMLHGDSDGYP